MDRSMQVARRVTGRDGRQLAAAASRWGSLADGVPRCSRRQASGQNTKSAISLAVTMAGWSLILTLWRGRKNGAMFP